MYLLYIIYLLVLIGVSHYIGTDWLGLDPNAGSGSAFDIYMCSVLVLGFLVPCVLPHAIDFYKGVKHVLIEKVTGSSGLATILALLITIVSPFLLAFAILLTIMGIHLFSSWLLSLFKK